MKGHFVKRAVAVFIAVLAAIFCLAGAASAHVTVTAPGATAGGGDQEITFRVPVEKDSDTVKVAVALPTKTPIASVDVKAIPGWTHTQQTVKLATPIKTDDGDITSAVSEITWTATGDNGIKPGEFGSFTIIAGQLPAAKSLTFKALQKYRDGTVTKWIETAAPGSSVEPQNPAPVLALAPKGDATTAPTTAPKAAGATGNTGPVVLSIIALVAAVGALGLALVTRART